MVTSAANKLNFYIFLIFQVVFKYINETIIFIAVFLTFHYITNRKQRITKYSKILNNFNKLRKIATVYKIFETYFFDVSEILNLKLSIG